MDQNLIYAFEIMGKGMLSIFTVILLLTFIVVILGKVTNLSLGKKKNNTEE
jgi:Na+-transporting methylmalonyl-CoA/oxaloacetate decarboxylase gamma subunit